MANRQCSGARRQLLIARLLPLLLGLTVVVAGPSGRAEAGSGTTCFQGMHYSSGAAGCDPHASGMYPPPGGVSQPPGDGTWWACVPQLEFFDLNQSNGWGIDPMTIHQSLFWLLRLFLDSVGNLTLLAEQPTGPCQSDPPPPPANPVIYTTYDSILAFVPEAFWSGTATCPAGDQAGDACPPSVGKPISVWVTAFASARGPTSVCSNVLSPFLYLTRYQACLRWSRVGSITWDFDDETVNGTRIAGQNYGVIESGPGSVVSHMFQYPSGFDPLRNCVRPCPGDALGPPLPGHPDGSPAFQVTVSSIWEVQLQQIYSTGGPLIKTPWQTLDLRTLGAPTADFTATSLIPIPVVEYGASPP